MGYKLLRQNLFHRFEGNVGAHHAARPMIHPFAKDNSVGLLLKRDSQDAAREEHLEDIIPSSEPLHLEPVRSLLSRYMPH